jgi:type IV pilus assembly protein PilN
MTSTILDLLRERRREIGQPSLSWLLKQRPVLVRRGLILGSAMVGVVLGGIGLIGLISLQVRERIAGLEPIEVQANALKAQVSGRRQELDRLKSTNTAVANRITNTATSSGLLTSLQLLAPAGVQLETVDVQQPGQLVVKGKAEDPNAFSRINALQLSLASSPLLTADSLQIKRVDRPNSSTSQNANDNKPAPFVKFEISGGIAQLPAQRQLLLLQQLGADGRARRLQRLQAEGLL